MTRQLQGCPRAAWPHKGAGVARFAWVGVAVLVRRNGVEGEEGPSFFDATGALVRGTGGWSGVQLQDGTWVRTRGMITFDANQLIQTVRGHVESLCGTLA